MAAKLFVLLIFIVFAACGGDICYGQVNASNKSNLEIMEQNISGELEKFFYYPDVNRNLQFVFFVESAKHDKTEKKFIESVIKKSAEKNKLRISFSKDKEMFSADSAYYKAKVEIAKLKTDYPRFKKNKFLSEKTLEREISSVLNIEIKQNDGTTLVKDDITTIYKGEIPLDDYEQFQTEEYRFTQSVPPNISFMETIIFPAAIVIISAAATILFFTVRSK